MYVIVRTRIGAIGRRLVSGIAAWKGARRVPCVIKTRDANIGKKADIQHRRRKEACVGVMDARLTNGHKNNSTESRKS